MGRKSSFANFLYFLVKIWAEKVIPGMDFTLILLYPLYSPLRSITVTNRISSLLWIILYLTEQSSRRQVSPLEMKNPRSNLSSWLFYLSLPQFLSLLFLFFPFSKAPCSVCCQTFRKELWKYSVLALLVQLPNTASWCFSSLTKCFQLLDPNFIKSLLSNGSLMGPSFSLFNQFIVPRGKNSLI